MNKLVLAIFGVVFSLRGMSQTQPQINFNTKTIIKEGVKCRILGSNVDLLEWKDSPCERLYGPLNTVTITKN